MRSSSTRKPRKKAGKRAGEVKRWRFFTRGRTLYVYAPTADAAIRVARKAGFSPSTVVIDKEPWATSYFEDWSKRRE